MVFLLFKVAAQLLKAKLFELLAFLNVRTSVLAPFPRFRAADSIPQCISPRTCALSMDAGVVSLTFNLSSKFNRGHF